VREPRVGRRGDEAGIEALQQAAVVQRLHHAPEQPQGLRQPGRRRQPLQHDRVRAAQAQLAGQQQPGGATANDHHVRVCVHAHWDLRSAGRGRPAATRSKASRSTGGKGRSDSLRSHCSTVTRVALIAAAATSRG
jgi:hypothetical protein